MKKTNYCIDFKDINTLKETNRNISLLAARDSIILLKNDNNTLPLKTKEIDLFGNGARHTIKGGLGSGEVNEIDFISIYQAFINRDFTINSKTWLDRYDNLYQEEIKEYSKRVKKLIYKFDFINFMGQRINFIPGDKIKEEDINSDTCIYVISRFSGEGKDLDEKEYKISDIEKYNLELCSKKYKNLILILNVGAFFDLSFCDNINISSIVFMGQLGIMGSIALVDVLTNISPSGSLPFTYPKSYDDIPYSNEFSYKKGSLDSNYKEGIYVGYRYYDTFKKEVRYPFGYGLTYSKFLIDNFSYNTSNDIININFDVKNIGKYKAKSKVLLFLSQPKSIGEEKSLVGYFKTKELEINEKCECNISFSLFDFAYTSSNKRLLSKGIYIISYGTNSIDTKPIYKFKLEEDIILYEFNYQLSNFKDELEKEIIPSDIDIEEIKLDLKYENKINESNYDFSILNNLSIKDKINLCVGSGVLPKSNYLNIPGVAGYTTPKVKNIPSLALADGPQGIRVSPKIKIKNNGSFKSIIPSMDIYNYLPKLIKKFKYAKDSNDNVFYQYSTSFPIGIFLAATFNNDLIKEVGNAISNELEYIGISYYLAPAINIIKNPIGGRTFEYYSEDPLLAGLTAANLINGIESNNHYPVLKHYAANNLEYMRNTISANISLTALKDIYLKPFMLAIKYSSVKAIMTSYNKINHKYVSNNPILLNDILRKEFGFNGVIMTDWLSTGGKFGSHSMAIKSGNDLIMPGSKKAVKEIYKSYKKGIITDFELNKASYNVLNSIINTSVYKKYSIIK